MKINEKIPDFEFEIFHNEEISKIKLSTYGGKWLILLFYPADFTFVCPTELEDAALHYDEFKKLNAEIISVSTDTAFVHKAWHDHSESIKKIQYPMAADPHGRMSRAFGTYVEDDGLSIRASFIIDPDRNLIFYEMHSNNIGRNIKEILRKLQAAIFTRENPGQVCPARWEPGKKTLRPSTEMVGKI
jgi:peroxiredoxin (alkyl hydroperoxide reductase subunit C)